MFCQNVDAVLMRDARVHLPLHACIRYERSVPDEPNGGSLVASSMRGTHAYPHVFMMLREQEWADLYARDSGVAWPKVIQRAFRGSRATLLLHDLLYDALTALDISDVNESLTAMTDVLHVTYGATEILRLDFQNVKNGTGTSAVLSLADFELARAKHVASALLDVQHCALLREQTIYAGIGNLSLLAASVLICGMFLYKFVTQ